MAKRRHGPYDPDAPTWVKIKNRQYSQAIERHERFERKFTPSQRVAIADTIRKTMPERRGDSNQENSPDLRGSPDSRRWLRSERRGKLSQSPGLTRIHQHAVEVQLVQARRSSVGPL